MTEYGCHKRMFENFSLVSFMLKWHPFLSRRTLAQKAMRRRPQMPVQCNVFVNATVTPKIELTPQIHSPKNHACVLSLLWRIGRQCQSLLLNPLHSPLPRGLGLGTLSIHFFFKDLLALFLGFGFVDLFRFC
jgi:hypothetical protein